MPNRIGISNAVLRNEHLPVGSIKVHLGLHFIDDDRHMYRYGTRRRFGQRSQTAG